MTIDTYMQYLGAFVFTFLVLFIVSLGLWFFICLVRGKLPVPLPPQTDGNSIADISSISQLQQKDEEIKKLKQELHETKQYAGLVFHEILHSGQKHDNEQITKIALEGLNKMRP